MSLRLAIVVPCYNEQEVLSETNWRLLHLLVKMNSQAPVSADSGEHHVDDGSQSQISALIEGLSAANLRAHGIKLMRSAAWVGGYNIRWPIRALLEEAARAASAAFGSARNRRGMA